MAAQRNGKIINFSNVARDVGIDDKTAKVYFEILGDTLIGYFLEPHHNSVRKQVICVNDILDKVLNHENLT